MKIEVIIEGVKKGNVHSEREMVNHLAPGLMTTAKRYLKEHNLCKDILQDTFIKIFKNIAKQDSSKGSFIGWAHRICVNECLQYLNKKKIKYTDLDAVSINKSVHPEVFSQLAVADLLEKIEELPVQYRTVFNLVAIEGYKHEEVAELLNINVSTSRSNYSRARQKLNTKLTDEMVKIS